MTTQVATGNAKKPVGSSPQVGVRLRRGLARDARPARRQGRGRCGDDAVLGAGPGPGRIHDHHRGVRGLHARLGRRGPPASKSPGRGGARVAWKRWPASVSGTRGSAARVSVRSGARVSMPGMMDTVLNLGLNDESTAGLAARTGDERFACDCYRRLVQMFGNVVRGVPGERFQDEIARVKRERGVTLDTELDAAALRELTEHFRSFFDFPHRPAGAADRVDSRRVRLVDGRAGRSSIAASTVSPTTGVRPSTCSRWCTATRARPRARGWRSAATR